MKKLQTKIEENAHGPYQKSYKTLETAKKQVEKAELRLDMYIDALYIALPSGRITVAIVANRCVANDFQMRGHEMSTVLHGTKGWFCFN